MNSYVKALLKLCQNQKDVDVWIEFLERLCVMTKNPILHKIITYPGLSLEQRASCFDDIVAQSDTQKSLVWLLCRDCLVSKASSLLHAFKKQQEEVASVRVGVIKSESEINSEIFQMIQNKFSNHLKKDVQLSWQQDPNIIGVEATVGSHKYSLTLSDIIEKINQELLRG